jgi:hypothetical protein
VEYLMRGWLRAIVTPKRINKAPSSWTMLVGGWVEQVVAQDCGITSKGDVHSFCSVIPPIVFWMCLDGGMNRNRWKGEQSMLRQRVN